MDDRKRCDNWKSMLVDIVRSVSRERPEQFAAFAHQETGWFGTDFISSAPVTGQISVNICNDTNSKLKKLRQLLTFCNIETDELVIEEGGTTITTGDKTKKYVQLAFALTDKSFDRKYFYINGFCFKGKEYKCDSGKEMMVMVMQILYSEHREIIEQLCREHQYGLATKEDNYNMEFAEGLYVRVWVGTDSKMSMLRHILAATGEDAATLSFTGVKNIYRDQELPFDEDSDDYREDENEDEN